MKHVDFTIFLHQFTITVPTNRYSIWVFYTKDYRYELTKWEGAEGWQVGQVSGQFG